MRALGPALLAIAALACAQPELAPPRADDCASLSEGKRVVSLLDFEAEVDLGSQLEPRTTFGAQSSLAVEAEDGNRFLRVQYEKLAAAPTGAVAQSVYSVMFPSHRVSAGATLQLRYRSRGVNSAVLTLSFLDQKIWWRLNPSGPSDWTQACLRLDSRFEKDPTSSPLISLWITSYSSKPSPSRPTYFDLDDLRLLESPEVDPKRLRVLQKLIERDNASRASIDAALELRNVRPSRRRYLVGDRAKILFEVRNASDTPLQIPRDRTGSDEYPLVTTQAWIEPLDAAARRTDFGIAARRGRQFAAGGFIRFLPQPILRAGQTLTFSEGMPDLAPGRYRASVELKSIADYRILATRSATFEVEPAR